MYVSVSDKKCAQIEKASSNRVLPLQIPVREWPPRSRHLSLCLTLSHTWLEMHNFGSPDDHFLSFFSLFKLFDAEINPFLYSSSIYVSVLFFCVFSCLKGYPSRVFLIFVFYRPSNILRFPLFSFNIIGFYLIFFGF